MRFRVGLKSVFARLDGDDNGLEPTNDADFPISISSALDAGLAPLTRPVRWGSVIGDEGLLRPRSLFSRDLLSCLIGSIFMSFSTPGGSDCGD